MIELTIFGDYFDEAYKEKYSDARYKEICDLVEVFGTKDCLKTIRSKDLEICLQLVRPVVAIKDYKSDSSFQDGNLLEVIKIFNAIKQLNKSERYNSKNFKSLFARLVTHKTAPGFDRVLRKRTKREWRKTGFDFATVSAVFHFCHPDKFPIADRFVVAACQDLNRDYQKSFPKDLQVPEIPKRYATAEEKWELYLTFIRFVRHIKRLQEHQIGSQLSYRQLDKMLMIYGKKENRQKATKHKKMSKGKGK